MKKLFTLMLLAMAAALISCSGRKEAAEYPMFWTWLDYYPSMNIDSVAALLNETGIDGIILNAPTDDDYRTAIPVLHDHGIRVYAWLWTLNPEHDRGFIVSEHPDWLSVNRNGESLAETRAYVDYYKFMCPALPEVREYLKEKARRICEIAGIEGISIDYHRFVDVILPTTLWSKYGIVQDREYPEWDYGYHPEMIRLFMEQYGYDPREQADPSADEKWLQFRCDQVTEAANEIAEVVHSHGKVMAASPFPTPAMSRKMVRQDWGRWNLDIVFPMVYHNFYTGQVRFISDCTADNVRQKNPMTTLYCGMMATNGPEMFECMDAALKSGAEGIAIFTVSSLRSPDVRARFREYADSARAARSSRRWTPATPHPAVEASVFDDEEIMQGVEMRMKAWLSLARALRSPQMQQYDAASAGKSAIYAMQVNTPEQYIANLTRTFFPGQPVRPEAELIADFFREDYGNMPLQPGGYELTDEYDITRIYRVTDAASGVTFMVRFYYYGSIFSGWSVEPEEESYSRYKALL